jgi:hypothetical protein
MPELDGFAVIEALRRREQTTGRHLPVIALTARAMKGDRERCLQAGMDDYLAKPVQAAELFAAIDRVVARRKHGGETITKEDDRVPPSSILHHPCATGPLDAGTLLTSCDSNPGLLAQMTAVFQAIAPTYLGRVREAVENRDAAELCAAAHKLRGLVSAFSSAAADAALALEQAGGAGQFDGVADHYATLAGMISDLIPVLADLSIEELRARQEPDTRAPS